MKFEVICVFPETIESYCSVGILGRALKKNLIELKAHDLKQYGIGKFKKIDDRPYGGGIGLILRPEPIFSAYEQIDFVKERSKVKTILLTPRGETFNQRLVEEKKLTSEEQLIIICGRYEGIDERVSSLADYEISLGDFVLSGGEIAAMAIIDTVSRLIPGILLKSEVHTEESFSFIEKRAKREYPQYTRPALFKNLCVPEVLTKGNHALIKKWRAKNRK